MLPQAAPRILRARPLGRRRLRQAALVVGLVLLLGLTPTAPARAAAVRPAAPPAADLGAGRLPTAPAGPAYDLFGTLQGIDPSGAPGPFLGNASLEVLQRPCSGLDRCPFVTATLTNATTGAWNLSLAPGTYFLASNRTPSFGGTVLPITLPSGGSGLVGPILLDAEPFAAYDNATFLLPAWNNLSAYAANCNAALPCRTGNPAPVHGAQQPLLSWTADGVYYVNATDRLVFYWFANHTVRDVGPWTPLYDNVMSYEGIENTEWITADGSWVYEMGCAALCTQFSSVEFYAVNTSTGAVFSHVFGGVQVLALLSNAQIDMIGEHGNLSIAALDLASGSVLGYNLWNRTQWTLGTLPFFEANNLYWIPMIDSYLDVRAEGSAYDEVVQERLGGPAPGTTLATSAYELTLQGFEVNGVDGVVYNLTAQTLDFTCQDTAGSAITYQARLSDAGLLENLTPIWGNLTTTFGKWPNATAYPNVVASEHRPSLLVTGDAFAGYWDGWFENDSALVDPTSGVWTATNLSFAPPTSTTGTFRQSGPTPASLEGLFYNTSYALLPWSYDCRTNESECPVQGNTSSVRVPGTVWWSWRDGLPEFPFPTSAPLQEASAPGGPTDLNLTPVGRDLTARWNASSTPASELLAYELSYAPADGGASATLWLAPGATAASFGPLAPATSYNVSLVAWNLHGPSAPTTAVRATPALQGVLHLTVDPTWANVTLNGSALALLGGQANLTLDVGPVALAAEAAGYEPFEGSATVSYANVTNVTIDLVGIAPVLEGSLDPAYAAFRIDGVPVPLEANGSFVATLAPGLHELTASSPGYLPLGPDPVSLSYGETLQEPPLRLQRAMGWLAGTVSPGGATVTLDGAPLNFSGGNLNLTLPTGSYWLDVAAPGYAPAVAGPLVVTAGNVTPVAIALAPLTGLLELSVAPANATVLLDNATLALNGGAASLAVPAGPHELDVRAPGFDPYRLDRTVAPNETLVLNLTLVPSVGELLGRLSPASAQLLLDGRPAAVDYLGAFQLTVPAGPHRLAASSSGFRAAGTNLSVPDHGVVWLNLTLVALPPSPFAGTAVLLGAGLGLAGLLLVVAATVLLVRRRRRRP